MLSVSLDSGELPVDLRSAEVRIDRGRDYADRTLCTSYNFRLHIILETGDVMTTFQQVRELEMREHPGATGSVGYVRREAMAFMREALDIAAPEPEDRPRTIRIHSRRNSEDVAA